MSLPTSFDMLAAMKDVEQKIASEQSHCHQEAVQFQTNVAVYNHFKAMEIAYGHCAHLLSKKILELYPEEKP